MCVAFRYTIKPFSAKHCSKLLQMGIIKRQLQLFIALRVTNKHLIAFHGKAMVTTFGGAAYLACIGFRFLLLQPNLTTFGYGRKFSLPLMYIIRRKGYNYYLSLATYIGFVAFHTQQLTIPSIWLKKGFKSQIVAHAYFGPRKIFRSP